MKTLVRQLSAFHSGIRSSLRAARRRHSYLAGLAGALLVSSLGACSRPSEPAPPAAPGTTRSDQVATRPEREETTTTAPQPTPSLPESEPAQPPSSPRRLRGPGTDPAPASAAQRGSPEGRLPRAAWWHQKELSESLGLSAQQVQRLDALQGQRTAELREETEAMRRARQELESALAEGDWEAARHAFEAQAAAGVELARAQGELTIAAFEILSPEQRRTAVEKLPQILRQPWIGGPGRERRGRPGDRSAEERPPGFN